MSFFAGIDLHSNNSYLAVICDQGKRCFGKRLPNSTEPILSALKPFKEDMKGIVVESTYNWYWLVDTLVDNGYEVHLANPSANVQYSGLKHSDDESEAFWLADLKRLNILCTGYIYPKEYRALRDLLRRRLLFVRQRTSQILSLQSMITRNLSIGLSASKIKRLPNLEAKQLLKSSDLYIQASHQLSIIRCFGQEIDAIEKAIKSRVGLNKQFAILKTIPGIGEILGLTIMLEIGDIGRFESVGNYSSYCRCVASRKTSNDKKKGEGNRKNGNKYLGWAYVEAANFMRRFCPEAQKFYQRKEAKTNKIVAVKALSNKIARASYYMMRDQAPFNVQKCFA